MKTPPLSVAQRGDTFPHKVEKGNTDDKLPHGRRPETVRDQQVRERYWQLLEMGSGSADAVQTCAEEFFRTESRIRQIIKPRQALRERRATMSAA